MSNINQTKHTNLLTFFSITLFYFFEVGQISYFNVLAPYFLSHGVYNEPQIAGLSSAYYYGNVLGLLPVGYALDHFPLRKTLLWAILGSVIGAFLLAVGHNYSIEWIARFLCGFFGGAFSFVGGIRVLVNLFSHRFTFFIGLFLAAGMLGALVCQYPLLFAVEHIGTQGAMAIMVIFGILVGAINLLWLHPAVKTEHANNTNQYPGSFLQMCGEILKNYRNWCDCIMVILLDTPVSIIGTLWGVVLLTSLYHFSEGISAAIVMSMFVGLMIGSPLWGALADRYPTWMIILGALVSLLIVIAMLLAPHTNALVVACLLFFLGLFSSCQTIGFTWLTMNMRPELIGRNSAFNSMILMGAGGWFKQVGAMLLARRHYWLVLHLQVTY